MIKLGYIIGVSGIIAGFTLMLGAPIIVSGKNDNARALILVALAEVVFWSSFMYLK